MQTGDALWIIPDAATDLYQFHIDDLHCRIHNMLGRHDLSKRYSPRDVLESLELAGMLEIGNEWKISKIPG